MRRRKFLEQAGFGAATLVGLPTLENMVATSVQAEEDKKRKQTNFHFVSFSKAGPAATPTTPQHRIAMAGSGKITPSQVEGGGGFNHFLFPSTGNPPPGGIPLSIVATGTWKAKQLISFNVIGTWGVFAAGILEMLIHLVPEEGGIIPATLEVVCNIGGAGLVNPGEEEGFILTIPGVTVGPFTPFVPALGLTAFTIDNEREGRE